MVCVIILIAKDLPRRAMHCDSASSLFPHKLLFYTHLNIPIFKPLLISPPTPTRKFMATDGLKVNEIRAQLSQRGLSTAGTRPILVAIAFIILLFLRFLVFFTSLLVYALQLRRLESALEEEKKKLMESDGDLGTSRKRQRDSDAKDADSEAPRKIKAVDQLRSMNVKRLREKASARGLSADGTKKELLERLCADEESVSGDNDRGNCGVVA